MPIDREEYEFVSFGGVAIRIAETEYKGQFPGRDGERVLKELWKAYVEAGKPKGRPRWLREKLAPLFPCLDERPRWVNKKQTPDWPWRDGRPMKFIRQFTMPSNGLPSGHTIEACEVYIFLTGEPSTSGGWTAEFVVVTDNSTFDL